MLLETIATLEEQARHGYMNYTLFLSLFSDPAHSRIVYHLINIDWELATCLNKNNGNYQFYIHQEKIVLGELSAIKGILSDG